MSIVKRAWISITRRKNNSIVIFLIIFILSNVLLITLTASNSIKNTKEMVLEQYPPVVSIDYNYENYGKKEYNPELTLDKVETLYSKSKDIIKSYDYSLSISLDKTDEINLSNISEKVSQLEEIEGLQDYLVLSGTQLSSTSLIDEGKAKLIKGKGFSDEDIKNANPKVIVSKQFAEANALEIGTILSLKNVLYEMELAGGAGYVQGDEYFSEEIDLEVVGILEINEIEDFIKKENVENSSDTSMVFEKQQIADRLYVPNMYVNNLIIANNQHIYEKYGDEAESMPLTKTNNVAPKFVLNDMKDLEKFTTIAKEIYNENDFSITSIVDEYESIAKPLNSMSELLDLIFKISILASIVIITLVLCVFMYFRKKEMGILLALGEKREKIFTQLLIETLLISILAATLAIFTSMFFSNMLMDNTMNSLLTSTTNQTVVMGSGYGLNVEEIANQYQGGFSLIALFVFYLTLIITIVVSQLATMLYLLRLNPKKILM